MATEQTTKTITVTRRVSVPPTKKCARCGAVKSTATEFYGKVPSSYCKACSNEMHKEQRQKVARDLAEYRAWKAERGA